MSVAWRGGSTRAWRRRRAFVLERDGYRCRLRLAGVCTGVATCVHHVKGREHGDDLEFLLAACQPCNRRIGNPVTSSPGQVMVAWLRAQPGVVRLAELMARYPDIHVGQHLARAVKRGEVRHAGRGMYAAGSVTPPPLTGRDPAPRPRTNWSDAE